MIGGSHGISYTSTFSSEPIQLDDSVSFGSADTYVAQNMSPMAGLTSLYLRIKTQEANGLILFREGRNQDFVALELVQVSDGREGGGGGMGEGGVTVCRCTLIVWVLAH